RHPEVPAEFEVVVARCLEADPSQRYQTAAELAADLQAIADDAPLRYAREPLPSRVVRWTRRNRIRLPMAAPLIMLLAVIGGGLAVARREENRLNGEVRDLLSRGMILLNQDHLEQALTQFDLAIRLASRGKGSRAAAPRDRVGESVRLAGGLDDL